MEEATIDEAVWSNAIKRALISKSNAARIIRQDKMPLHKSEQMVKSNYPALLYFSISRLIVKERSQYNKSMRQVETSGSALHWRFPSRHFILFLMFPQLAQRATGMTKHILLGRNVPFS